MENNNSNKYIENTTKQIDDLVWKLHSQKIIDNFSNISIIKTIFEIELFKLLNKWFEENFKIIIQVLWWLWIISWVLILFIQPINYLLNLFDSSFSLYFTLAIIIWFANSILAFISWVWFLKNKKWIPFITIIWFFSIIWWELILNITRYITISRYIRYYNNWIYWIIIGFILMTTISLIYTCIIVKNNDKFTN